MAKVKDDTWERWTVESTDGEYPIYIKAELRYWDGPVVYNYWGEATIADTDVLATEIAQLVSDIDDVATA